MLQKEWLYLLEGRIVNGKEAPPIVKKHKCSPHIQEMCLLHEGHFFRTCCCTARNSVNLEQ